MDRNPGTRSAVAPAVPPSAMVRLGLWHHAAEPELRWADSLPVRKRERAAGVAATALNLRVPSHLCCVLFHKGLKWPTGSKYKKYYKNVQFRTRESRNWVWRARSGWLIRRGPCGGRDRVQGPSVAVFTPWSLDTYEDCAELKQFGGTPAKIFGVAFVSGSPFASQVWVDCQVNFNIIFSFYLNLFLSEGQSQDPGWGVEDGSVALFLCGFIIYRLETDVMLRVKG